MAAEAPEQKGGKSYLSSAVESINPWAAKPTSSTTLTKKTKTDEVSGAVTNVSPIGPGDHSITHLYGQSLHTYPPDCPPLNVQWFHAVDVAKRKSQILAGKKAQTSKPPTQPKKFSAFSVPDSNVIEARYQKLLEVAEEQSVQAPAVDIFPSPKLQGVRAEGDDGARKEAIPREIAVKVPVNEDFLFDVDIEQRELAPVYWHGPVYEVRRGTWFFQEGSQLRPCEENLAAQLEEGYLKLKPWVNSSRPRSQSGAKTVNFNPSEENIPTTTKKSPSTSHLLPNASAVEAPNQSTQCQPQSYRLFGTYMNNVATYHGSATAWLCTDTILSRVTSSVYERFAGGGYMSGVKLTRGYSEPTKTKDKDKDKGETLSSAGDVPGLDAQQQRLLKRRSAPPPSSRSNGERPDSSQSSSRRIEDQDATLRRQLSSLIERSGRDSAGTEEEVQERQEQEIQDYHTQTGEAQGREVDHIILVTHGIGQQLSLRMESVNFVHDVNILRKTMKSVYANSPDLKALNSELGAGHGNCRVQVLPVCWRHLLDFPRQRGKRDEYDLGDMPEGEFSYPSLDDITVEGVAFARSLISDLALDVLLYQSSYREQISRIVLGECNRIFNLYRERNPEFSGKVHLMGHSLGSAILFDILCRQKDSEPLDDTNNPLCFWPRRSETMAQDKGNDMAFCFEVENCFCLGSPIGLFQMLEGRTIAARPSAASASLDMSSPNPGGEQFFSTSAGATNDQGTSSIRGLPPWVSSPKTRQLFNIFHPSDPISYRLEPLISPAMTTLRPQGLPYTRKGILDAANQGLTGIGAKVGQSVSGLWSSISAGIANNMLNRSLGLTNEEVSQMADQMRSSQGQQEAGAAPNTSPVTFITDEGKIGDKTDERQKQLADFAVSGEKASPGINDPTLIDDELETLFSQFQKRRAARSLGDGDNSDEAQDELRKARKMQMEENKIRALNRNGRVDYSIQESMLDFNPINAIASHMGYWADVDVNHFILSQLLLKRSNKR